MKSTRFDSVAAIGRKLIKNFALGCTSLTLVLCITLYPGCSGDFLGLEDYQRDLLFGIGSLAFGLVDPADGGDVGPAGNYASLPALAKWMLSSLMIVGRVEIFPVLVLFTKDLWRR